MVNVRKHIYVHGRVQGVGFRAFIKRNAKKNNVHGWAKNLTDGRVETILTGKKINVERLIKKLKKGPRMARVNKVDIFDETYRGEFTSFSIKY